MKKRGHNHKYIITYTLSFFLIIISIVMAVLIFGYFQRNITKAAEKQFYDHYYVMIPEDRKLDFWQSVYEGAYTRGIEQNAYVELLGENLSENYSNIDLMKIALASKVDGIILSADDNLEMTELINQAEKENIPVITVYNDNSKSNRNSFVGVSGYNLGREYGRQVLNIIDSKETAIEPKFESSQWKYPSGNTIKIVVLVNSYAENSSQNIICSGIQETIENEKPKQIDYDLSLVSVDDRSAFSVEESIRDIFMEDGQPDIIICLDELNTTCVYQAVVDYNRVGQISILGYYDSDTIINAIERDVIYATITVDTNQMGTYCVNALTEIRQSGNTNQYFTTDITLINKANINEYIEGDSQ